MGGRTRTALTLDNASINHAKLRKIESTLLTNSNLGNHCTEI